MNELPVRSPFVELLGALADVFAQLGAGWYLFGAQAALLHGAARLTADVDVTVDLQDKDPEVLAKVLTEAGFQMRVEDIAFTHARRRGGAQGDAERSGRRCAALRSQQGTR
ncbi:hypothetical protein [Sorangium sp. So ce131]|uniref:hypothetical protein n=1 Tax=Sorangium sp. So ce131 TaxID=3133282 RepID=UPI003F5E967E